MITLTDAIINEFFSAESKFVVRRYSEDKRCYEVVEMLNEDWREVISDDQCILKIFPSFEEAKTYQRQLHVRYILSNNTETKNE